MNTGYLECNITDFFNWLINNCRVLNGSEPLEKEFLKDIVNLQYYTNARIIYIETKKFNYVIQEKDGEIIHINEYYKGSPAGETQ